MKEMQKIPRVIKKNNKKILESAVMCVSEINFTYISTIIY